MAFGQPRENAPFIPDEEELGTTNDKKPDLRLVKNDEDKATGDFDPRGGLSTKEFMRKSREEKAASEEKRAKIEAYKIHSRQVLQDIKDDRAVKEAKKSLDFISPTDSIISTPGNARTQQIEKPSNKSAEVELVTSMREELGQINNEISEMIQEQANLLRWPLTRKGKEEKAHKILLEQDSEYQDLLTKQASVTEDISKSA